MKVLCTSIMLILAMPVLYAQNTPVQMIPQTPTAYSLGKYGDIPVSLYTGVPNISIPVYTLKDHDASVNISLSYHGSGIKVDEIASYVGLGWSLDAGGMITRVVRGRPETLLSDGSLFPKRSDIQFYDPGSHMPKADFIAKNQLFEAATNQLDNEPDQFYFNFMGRSGKFVFDKEGQAVLENKEGLEISWKFVSTYDEQNFVIRDETGAVYEFTDYETTFYPEEGISRISAWYLSKITSPGGNVIRFEYYPPVSSNQLSRSYTTSLVTVLPYRTSVTPPLDVTYQGTGFTELRLHRIKSDNGEIEFIYKPERRKDYPKLNVTSPASSALAEIRIYKPDAGLLRKFMLLTSYFQANDVEKYNLRDKDIYNYLDYRLRLDAVQEYGADGSTPLPPTTFRYLGDNDPATDDPYTLPYRLSPSQDHWGFYNQAYNTHMIPGLSAAKSIYMPSWFRQFSPPDGPEAIFTKIDGGANRNPDAEAMKADMLSEVHYPTGGYTFFQFEANDFAKNIPGVRIGKITNYPVLGKPVETDYTYQGYSYYNPVNFYFEFYQVTYFYGEINPRASTLQQFGIPVEQFSGVDQKKYIKINVQPQALLGHGAEVGYTNVTVSEPGKGTVTSIFTSQDNFPDYTDREYMGEYSIPELTMLDRLFYSEYVDDSSTPGAPYGSVNSKTLGSREWPYPEIYSNTWKRGLLSDRYTVSAGNVTLKEEHFNYYHQLLQTIPAFKVIKLNGASYEYVYSKYYVPATWSKIKSAEVKEYDQNGQHPLTTTTSYFYDNMAHMQPTRTEVARSDGRTEVTRTSYPLDYNPGSGFLGFMRAAHMLAYPVERVKYLDDGPDKKIVAGNVTLYQDNSKGLKSEELKLETASSVPYQKFMFSNLALRNVPGGMSVSYFKPDPLYKPLISYTAYDAKNNLLQYALSNDINMGYIWGYNLQYPVAEIKNAAVTECFYTGFEDDGARGTGHTGTHYYNGDYRVGWTAPNNRIYEISYWYRASGIWLFSGYQSYSDGMTLAAGDAVDDIRICPVNAQMTTYTYEPLVGMTSRTDVRSSTTYYEYDVFGRLHLVRDDEGNIIKKMCYSYAGQPEACDVPAILFWNGETTRSFKSEWCPAGSVPGDVMYTVPAHTYSSNVSQQDADAKAWQDVDANGQQYANAQAVCRVRLCVDCTGNDKKCIDGRCETGIKKYTSSTLLGIRRYQCNYHYEWSDGTQSVNYIQYSVSPCH